MGIVTVMQNSMQDPERVFITSRSEHFRYRVWYTAFVPGKILQYNEGNAYDTPQFLFHSFVAMVWRY